MGDDNSKELDDMSLMTAANMLNFKTTNTQQDHQTLTEDSKQTHIGVKGENKIESTSITQSSKKMILQD